MESKVLPQAIKAGLKNGLLVPNMKRFALRLILLLVLCSVLISFPPINIVKAGGTIYIRADGSVEPTTAPVQRNGNTYVFIGNINDSIVVERSNIIIDGGGYTVEGGGGPENRSGFSLCNVSEVTIKNTNINGFIYGIYLESTSNNTLFGNNITENNFDGVRLDNCSNNRIFGNTLTENNMDGIWVGYSLNNTISGNNMTNNGYGVRLDSSSDNSISGNNITVCNWVGVYLGSSSNNSVFGNNITENNLDGIRLYHSSNNTISGNNMTNNGYGMRLFYSSSNRLTGNSMADNEYNFGVGDGVGLSDFVNDVDVSNTVDGKPIHYWISERNMSVPLVAGYVSLVNCTGITVKNLNLTGNVQGLLLVSTTNSTIAKSSITNNRDGIRVEDSSNNKLHHNNFKDNIQQVYIPTPGYANVWDDGYPSGGNYWSDYTGADADGDYIGDTPYVVDLNNTDRFPLMAPYEPPDTTPPVVSILSPENQTYRVSDVSLTLTVSEIPSWIGYTLDGQTNVTVAGNTTLSGLSDGSHSLIVFAKDIAWNTGASETVYFSINTQRAEPFLTWIVAAIAVIAGVGAALLVYFVKVKKTAEHQTKSRH
jgi:parallel beta-helix repeat protein